jgi:hypothetical protein
MLIFNWLFGKGILFGRKYNFLRRGRLQNWAAHSKHSILKVSLDILLVDIRGQTNGSLQGQISGAFSVRKEFGCSLFLLAGSRTHCGDRKCIILNLHLNILCFKSRQILLAIMHAKVQEMSYDVRVV